MNSTEQEENSMPFDVASNSNDNNSKNKSDQTAKYGAKSTRFS